ncbi:MAG: class I SAM-dependent methyltransferase [Chloroflexi bacterium]|nr:class I SAM-dependent methyltransferase [Chloroflexota bacterium]
MPLAVLWEMHVQVPEIFDRHQAYRMARQYCRAVGKPLLRVGIRRGFLEPPNGDATLDIDPIIRRIAGGVQGDERAMPMFADKQFGAAFNEQTLEHLHSAEDVRLAVGECVRVADYAYLLVPSPAGIIAHLHPTHYLAIRIVQGGLAVRRVFHADQPAVFVPVPHARRALDSLVIGYSGGVTG